MGRQLPLFESKPSPAPEADERLTIREMMDPSRPLLYPEEIRDLSPDVRRELAAARWFSRNVVLPSLLVKERGEPSADGGQ